MLLGRWRPEQGRPVTHRHSSSEVHMASSKNTAVFGIYRTPDDAERAVDALMGNGFSERRDLRAAAG